MSGGEPGGGARLLKDVPSGGGREGLAGRLAVVTAGAGGRGGGGGAYGDGGDAGIGSRPLLEETVLLLLEDDVLFVMLFLCST